MESVLSEEARKRRQTTNLLEGASVVHEFDDDLPPASFASDPSAELPQGVAHRLLRVGWLPVVGEPEGCERGCEERRDQTAAGLGARRRDDGQENLVLGLLDDGRVVSHDVGDAEQSQDKASAR